MHGILAAYYKQVLENSSDSDLRQKVVFYYRLLKQDVQIAESILNQTEAQSGGAQFYEDVESEKRERLFMEFNSLSVVYGKPSETFLRDQQLKQSVAAERKYYPKERGFKTSDQTKLLQDGEGETTEQPAAQQEIDLLGGMGDSQPTAAATSGSLLDTGVDLLGGGGSQPSSNTNDLLGGSGLGGSNDLLGGSGTNDLLGGTTSNASNDLLGGQISSTQPSAGGTQYSLDGMMGGQSTGGTSASFLDSFAGSSLLQANNAPAISLAEASDLDSERFQQLWMQLPTGCGGQPISKSLRLDVQFATGDIESHFKENQVSCMASGQLGTELKFFFHCQLADKSGYFMLETLFNLQTKVLNCTVKSTRPDMESTFQQFLAKVLQKYTIG